MPPNLSNGTLLDYAQLAGFWAGEPIVEVLRTYPKQVLLAMGARFAENGAFYIFSVFVS